MRIEPAAIAALLHVQIDEKHKAPILVKGLNAAPGAAAGTVVFDPDDAVEMKRQNKKTILVRPMTTPDDVHGMIASEGILTSQGGATSHAAVVARGMGKPAVVGAESMLIDLRARQFTVKGEVVKEGDELTIDGTTGNVYRGMMQMAAAKLTPQFEHILKWADEYRRLGVYANADTPEDAKKARDFGAEGIGLCRTEHMFMEQERLPVVQEMIMAETPDSRRKCLEQLLPMQREDFRGILRAMKGLPVTIRLLDPPLHEFLAEPRRPARRGDGAASQSQGRPGRPLGRRNDCCVACACCTKRTRCSACASAASASSSLRSIRCRSARSWKPPPNSRKNASTSARSS